MTKHTQEKDMNQLLQGGLAVNWTPTSAANVGQFYKVGTGLIGLCNRDIAANALGSLVTGAMVVRLDNATNGAAFTNGAVVYMDLAVGLYPSASTANTQLGIALETVTTNTATIDVLINLATN
jgi:predicted RecA/RadA family phage recombinase